MEAFIKIIDNKKVSMTEQEYETYKNISKSYDRTGFKGSDLFKGLFNTDERGMIQYIGIPSGNQTSFEVFLFVCAVYEQQKMREFEGQMKQAFDRMKEKLAGIEARLTVVEKS